MPKVNKESTDLWGAVMGVAAVLCAVMVLVFGATNPDHAHPIMNGLFVVMGLIGCACMGFISFQLLTGWERVANDRMLIVTDDSERMIYLPGDMYPKTSSASAEPVLLAPRADNVGPHVITWKPDVDYAEHFLSAGDPVQSLRKLYQANPRINFEDYAALYGIEILKVDPPQRGKKQSENDVQTVVDTFDALVKRFQAVGDGAASFEKSFKREVVDKHQQTLDENPELAARLLALKDDAVLRLLEKMTR
jgi:hypothetical protein